MADNKYKVSKEFLDAWSKNSAEKLAEAKAKLDKYTSAYSTASKLVDDYIKATPGDAAVKDLFASQYTPTGPATAFDNSGSKLVEITNKIKEWNGSILPTKELKSNRNANEYYAKIQKISAKAPDDVFAEDAQNIRAKILSTSPDFKSDLDEDAFSALGLEHTQSDHIVPLTFLIKEYNVFNKSMPAVASPAGPVNESKPAEPTPVASPINEAEKGEKTKAASTLNPEKSAPAPVEATTGTVTTGKPEVPKEVTPTKVETGATVNVTVAPTPPATPAPAPSTPPAPTTPPVSAVPAASPINAPVKEEAKIGGVDRTLLTRLVGKSNVEKLASSSSTLNESKASSAVEKSKETIQNTISSKESNKETNTATTSTVSTLNSTTEDKEKPTLDISTLTRLVGKENAAKLTNTTSENISSSVLNETKKAEEIKTSVENTGKEAAGKIGGVTAELGTPKLPTETRTSTEITKTAPTLPQAKPASSTVKEMAKTEPVTMAKVATPSPDEKSESKEASPSASPAPSGETQGEKASSGVDFSGVEARLARLEILLSGPLDVKIIES